MIKKPMTSHPVLTDYILVFAISRGRILIAVGPAKYLATTDDAKALTQVV